MSKLKDEMIGAEGAVGDVADEALRLTCCEIDNIFQKVFTTAFVGNVQKILDEQDHPDKNNVLLNSACNEFLVTRTGNLYEIKYDEEVTVKQANFLDDKEKMADFKIQTKEDFLRSYSYLTEQEYDNTNAALFIQDRIWVKTQTNAIRSWVTVKELKEQLQKLDGNAEVVLQCDATGNNYHLSIRERFDYRIELEKR